MRIRGDCILVVHRAVPGMNCRSTHEYSGRERQRQATGGLANVSRPAAWLLRAGELPSAVCLVACRRSPINSSSKGMQRSEKTVALGGAGVGSEGNAALHCTALHCTVQHSTAQHSTALRCLALHQLTVLRCPVLQKLQRKANI